MHPPLNSPLHRHTRREPESDRRLRLAVAELVLRRVSGLFRGFHGVSSSSSSSFLVRLLLSLAPLPLPRPVRPLEALPALLVLGDDVVKGLALGGGRLADLARAQAPDDVRREYPCFEEAAVGGGAC